MAYIREDSKVVV